MRQPAEIISGEISLGENKVHCLKMGHGHKLLLAFHGFSNEAADFSIFLPYLKEEYTIVAVDLPGHGSTLWRDAYMEQKDLMALVQGIKNDFNVEKFSVIGYSLGGRIALNIIEKQPNWVEKVVLLAADGMKKNFWYNLATKNVFGKVIFKKIVENPQGWIKHLETLKKLHIIDESRYKFASTKLLNPQVNKQVAYVWPTLKKLIPLIPVVRYHIKKREIPVYIFMGEHDRVIKIKNAKHLTQGLKTVQLTTLNCGHHVVTAETLPIISKVLLED